LPSKGVLMHRLVSWPALSKRGIRMRGLGSYSAEALLFAAQLHRGFLNEFRIGHRRHATPPPAAFPSYSVTTPGKPYKAFRSMTAWDLPLR
jgi:hypothetical protein